ncbi:phage terminase large subunit family protein [Providencia heimbachae]|uniref:Phage terminase large subunit n=1 Tax=Providencia heimbachae ATCC 35613 TaxID=1354272 RepID=A0A1B7JGB3_9GAMM|nr:phage terminase large subunit family protein [Providencia heimbachae]OAT46999.1 phage terminase large subunit [Providencia heimbachae ATCC 35613]SQH13019.1 Bacteriophage tail assembly protein [Providencia heimbachae]
MIKQITAAAIKKDVGGLLRAPRRIPVADAVAKYMRVPVGAGNSVPWDPLVAPYIVEPMNCLASREFDAVVFVGPARTGKTIGLIDGWVVYNIICDPSDMLIVQMTRDKAQEHSKKRLARTFRASAEVAKRLSPRKNDNNVLDKYFLSGSFLKMGWPSINVMSSSDFKFVALTDYDRFPEDIDGEGDGYSLASKRTTTFMSAGMTLVESSPGRDITDIKWKRTSEHEAPPTTGTMALYNRGDRRRWYWPCPHCNEYFQPTKENMTGFRSHVDPVIASEAARLQCPHCLGLIEPSQKRELNSKGIWLIEGQKIDKQGNISGEPRRSRIASFWMEGPAAAYQTWSQLVYKLLVGELDYEKTGSEETLKAAINTDWGLPYLPKIAQEQRSGDELKDRAECWDYGSVPKDVRFLVATIDVQGGKKRRFVVQVTGYGAKGERWIVDRFDITRSFRSNEEGEAEKINPSSYAEDWDVLISDVLDKTYPLQDHENSEMGIHSMAVDTGGEEGVTDNAYKFWRKCKKEGLARRVYLFKGDGKAKSKLITKSYPDNTDRSDRRAKARGDVPIYLLQTNELKDRISAHLGRETIGPNYIHFPDWLDDSFYDELTYEERDSSGKWSKPGKGANEAFDLTVYAHALVILLGYEKIKWETPPKWAQLPDINDVQSSRPVTNRPSPASKPIQTQTETQETKPSAISAWTPVSSTSGGWV